MTATIGRAPAAKDQHSSTVARDLVHRASVAEVFLTGWHTESPQSWTVEAQWPRANRFHLSYDGARYDDLLVIETTRQAALCINIAARGMSRDTVFVLAGVDLNINSSRAQVGGRPASVTVHLELAAGRAGRQIWTTRVLADSENVATGTLLGRVMSTAVAARVRRAASSSADAIIASDSADVLFAPTNVGRHAEGDVAIARTRDGGLRLRIDTAHPVFFDHPLDHVPGLLLLEAARQVAFAATRSQPVTRLDARFERYIELDSPCEIAVERKTDAVESTFTQGTALCATIAVHLGDDPSP